MRHCAATTAAALLAALGWLAAAGCSPAGEPGTDRRRPDGEAAPPGEAAARIVSLAPSHTEILFALGAGRHVVAVTEADDFPAEVAELPKVGGAETLDVERVVAARPDVVVTLGSDRRPALDALRRAGLRVEPIPAARFGDLFAAIERLGEIAARPTAAAELSERLEARVERVRQALDEISPEERPRVFYEVWDEPLMTAGPETFIGELIELAGGRNLFADVGSLYPRVSPEAVLSRDPDVILAPDHHGEPLTAALLAERTGWGELRAVRSGRVYTVDGSLVSRPGPRLVDGLETIARLLHPDRFGEAAPPVPEPR